VDTFFGSLRYATRQFWASRVFTVTAVLTLALGIGGTTAIFTLIHAVMLRSLPVGDPQELYRVGDGDNCCVWGGTQNRWGMVSYPLFERLKENTPEFSDLIAFQAGIPRVSVRRDGGELTARPLRSEYVTGNYFTVLGIRPFGGRLLSPDDDRLASTPVVVMSHHAWQSIYGSDPSVVGSAFFIEGHPFTVIGVAPPGFFGDTLRADPPDIWIPLHQEPVIAGDGSLLQQSVSAWLEVIGRLKPGATVVGMEPRLTALLRQWIPNEAGYPSNWLSDLDRILPKQTIAVVPAGSGIGVMKSAYQDTLKILLGVCVLVLLIACANVANLLLARAVARRTQTAVRLAIGASRAQIVRQALVESVLLAVVGGVAGLAVAMGASRLLLALAFRSARFVPIDTSPSLAVLGFAMTLALLTGIIFGAAPAWFATRTDPLNALRGAGRSTGEQASFARRALLVLQATLSVVLVAGATMLGRSLNQLEHQNFGYEVRGRTLVAINPPPTTYSIARLRALYRDIEEQLTRLPGVRGAGLALYNPLTNNWSESIYVSGHPKARLDENSGAAWDRVSTNYLQNFGTVLVRGRMFTNADNETTAPVAIVNDAFVKQFFKSDEDPVDQHFGLDLPENASTFRIIGVVRDAKFAGFGLRTPAQPMFFVPLAQSVDYKNDLLNRTEIRSHFVAGIMLVTDTPVGQLEPLLTRTLADADSSLTIINVRTMQQQVELTFNRDRALASLAGLFGVVALILAAIGLYGVTAYSVAQRTNEIGLRMALGADRTRVIDLVLRGAFRRVLAGLVLGIPLAVGAGRLISAQLYGVAFWDPTALGLATIALAVCAFVAAVIPATRAASISPMRALRTE